MQFSVPRHNDYLILTRNYLRKYPQLQQMTRTLLETIDEIDLELQDESIKTASYGPEAGGSMSELNGTEQAASNRLQLDQRRRELITCWRRVSGLCHRLAAALDDLPEKERQCIELFFFQGYTYERMARVLYSSERTCRRGIQHAVTHIAVRLFGVQAEDEVIFVR